MLRIRVLKLRLSSFMNFSWSQEDHSLVMGYLALAEHCRARAPTTADHSRALHKV